MGYDIGYEIDTSADGDTVLSAFTKYKEEMTRIYGLLNEISGKLLTPEEKSQLQTGIIDGSRVTGNVSGNVEGSHVTGNINASQVSGLLSSAQIESGKVTGLEEFVNNLISESSSETSEQGDGITSSKLKANGYAEFGNGLIVQWGSHTLGKNTSYQAEDITFPKNFPTACYSVITSVRPEDSSVFNSDVGYSALLTSRIDASGFRAAITPANKSTATIYYIAIGS